MTTLSCFSRAVPTQENLKKMLSKHYIPTASETWLKEERHACLAMHMAKTGIAGL